MVNKNEPVWKVQQGQFSAAAWVNVAQRPDGGRAERVSVKLDKRYRDEDGAWHSSNSYTETELLRLRHFLVRVIDRVQAHQRELREPRGDRA